MKGLKRIKSKINELRNDLKEFDEEIEKIYDIAIKTIDSRQKNFDRTIRILILSMSALFMLNIVQMVYIIILLNGGI